MQSEIPAAVAPINSLNRIPITCAPGIKIEVAIAAKPFTDWLASVDLTKFEIRGIHFQSLDMFGPLRVGFIKFAVDLYDKNGSKLPGIIFARGGAVAVLAVFECEGEEYAVVTVQPRIATGSFAFTEVCAGMLDGSGNFKGVAALELEQELQVVIDPQELCDLSALAGYDKGFYLSPGGCEETIRLFAFRRKVTRPVLDGMNGRCTGVLEEGEQITLKIIKIDELLGICDAKTIIAHTLYAKFRDQVPVN